ncbi:MAG: hypothetical protein DWH80_00730 [Planctomycetota bacterium]|nr:MAG: hypothetical protein DWH80_00730 [Planctomycetota bacterium]
MTLFVSCRWLAQLPANVFVAFFVSPHRHFTRSSLVGGEAPDKDSRFSFFVTEIDRYSPGKILNPYGFS